jgi:hypothetical protein
MRPDYQRTATQNKHRTEDKIISLRPTAVLTYAHHRQRNEHGIKMCVC